MYNSFKSLPAAGAQERWCAHLAWLIVSLLLFACCAFRKVNSQLQSKPWRERHDIVLLLLIIFIIVAPSCEDTEWVLLGKAANPSLSKLSVQQKA